MTENCVRIAFLGLACTLLIIPAWAQSPVQSGGIAGRVVSGEGTPVSGVSVYAMPTDRPVKGRMRYFTTDEQGRFLISRLAPGAYAVRAFKLDAGYPDPMFAFFNTTQNLFPTVIVTADRVSETMVKLGNRGAKLLVRVLDRDTGETIEPADMELRRVDNPKIWLNSHSTNDPEYPGILRTWVPSLTAFSVRISADGYGDWSTKEATDIPCCRILVLYPEEERTLVVRLERKAPQRPR